MNWICLDDRAPLTPGPGGRSLGCTSCGREYEVSDGVPLFAGGAPEEEAVQRPSPPLEELWLMMRDQPAGKAAREFCLKHGYALSPHGADRKFLFPVPAGGTALELGPGFGDDSVDLAGKSGATVSIAPSLTHARIVRRHLRAHSDRGWPVAVMTDLRRLPLADRSIHVIALEDSAAAGFGLSNRCLREVAAEWKRVLAPDGVVFIGVANGLHRMPGLGLLRAALRIRPQPEPLNQQVKRWAHPRTGGRLTFGRTIRTMGELGFAPPVVYAPLPDARDSRVVLPVHDAQTVRYVLDHLIRKNSILVRMGLRAAQRLVDAGLFDRLVPYYYLIFGPFERD